MTSSFFSISTLDIIEISDYAENETDGDGTRRIGVGQEAIGSAGSEALVKQLDHASDFQKSLRGWSYARLLGKKIKANSNSRNIRPKLLDFS